MAVKRKRSKLLLRIASAIMSALTIFLSVFAGFDFTVKADIQLDDGGTIVKGDSLYYGDYIPGGSWSTHKYQWHESDGHVHWVYCIESNKGAPSQTNTDYPQSYLADNGRNGEYVDRILLAAAVAHGPGGGLAKDGREWWRQVFKFHPTLASESLADNENFMYIVTHIAANYAYMGISHNDVGTIYQGVPATWQPYFNDYMSFLAEVADGGMTFRDDNCPEGYATTYENFWVRIFEPPAGSGYQQMAFAAGQAQKFVRYGMRLKINVNKTTPNGRDLGKSLDGATYGLYQADGTKLDELVLHVPTDSGYNPNTHVAGQFDLWLPAFDPDDENPERERKYYIQEIKAPTGFKLDEKKYWITHHKHKYIDEWAVDDKISVDDPVFDRSNEEFFNYWDLLTATFTDEEDNFTPKVQIQKNGGTESVEGAVYTMYKWVYNDVTRDPVIGTATINTKVGGSTTKMTGDFNVSLGTADVGNWYYIVETKAPTNGMYKIENSTYFFQFVNEGGYKLKGYDQQAASLDDGCTIVVNNNQVSVNSKETEQFEWKVDIVKSGDSEDPRATLSGAKYGLYRSTDDSLIKEITLTVDSTNKKATGSFGTQKEPAGNYYIKETKEPHGYKLDTKKYSFHVNNKGELSTSNAAIGIRDNLVTATLTDDKVVKPFTPDIQIIKNGSCNLDGDKADVSKAKYGLFDSNNTLLQEISLTGTKTQGTGKFTYEIKELGTYYVKETYSPEYFDLDTTKYTFHVTLVDDELISDHSGFVVDATNKAKATVTVSEKPNKYRWQINVIKTAETTGDYTSLNDVKYGLFKENGEKMQEINLVGNNTGATGTFDEVISDKLEAGKYYVQETETVKGFRLNTKKYPFTVDVVGQKLTTSTTDIDITENLGKVKAVDESEKGKFTFVKKGDDGLTIEGAQFEVYLKSKLTYDDTTGTYNFDAVTPHQTLTADANGVVLSGDLNLGTYIIREIYVAPEYYVVDPFEVVIDQDLVTVDLDEITDRNVPIQIRCTKKDSGRDTVVLKAGTTYEIKDSAGNNVVDRSGATQFVCDDTGIILIDAELSPDTYTVTEVTPPNKYKDDSTPVVVKVDANLNYVIENGIHIHDVEFKNTEKLGDITITKTGKTLTKYEKEKFVWEEAPLPNATFEVRAREDIYSPDNQGTLLHAKDEVVGTIVTGTDGSATITDLHLGKYYLVETIAPVGYVLDQTPIEVELKDEDSHAQKVVETRTKFDEKQNVVLDLYKFDAETKQPLANAKFGIYADEDIKNFAGNVIVKKGDFLAYATSDKAGKINFDIDLPYNKYMVKEELVPWGYILNKTEFHVDAKYPDSKIESVTYKSEWGNDTVKGDVKFIKTGDTLTDFKDGKFTYENQSLKGAEFDVYANEVFTYDQAVDKNGNRTVYYKKDQKIEHIKTDENGTVTIKDYPLGSYYLIETKAPYGMTVRKDRYDFTIVYKDQYTPKVYSTESVLNERQHIDMKIIKEQKDGNGKKLSGGLFWLYAEEDIYNINGKVIVAKDTAIADATAVDGVIDFGLDLPHGKYYIKEITAPGDHLPDESTFHIDTTYKNQDIITNGVEVTIFNEEEAHFGRLLLNMGQKFFKDSKNNYVTGDEESNAGYSVIIGEASEVTAQKNAVGVIYVWAGVGAFVFLVIGACVLIAQKKKKALAGGGGIDLSEDPLSGEEVIEDEEEE